MVNVDPPSEFTGSEPVDHNTPHDTAPQDAALSTQDSPLSPQNPQANRTTPPPPTAPRTPEGKPRSALNAPPHGPRARLDPATLVPQSEREDFALLLEDFRDHLEPQS